MGHDSPEASGVWMIKLNRSIHLPTCSHRCRKTKTANSGADFAIRGHQRAGLECLFCRGRRSKGWFRPRSSCPIVSNEGMDELDQQPIWWTAWISYDQPMFLTIGEVGFTISQQKRKMKSLPLQHAIIGQHGHCQVICRTTWTSTWSQWHRRPFLGRGSTLESHPHFRVILAESITTAEMSNGFPPQSHCADGETCPSFPHPAGFCCFHSRNVVAHQNFWSFGWIWQTLKMTRIEGLEKKGTRSIPNPQPPKDQKIQWGESGKYHTSLSTSFSKTARIDRVWQNENTNRYSQGSRSKSIDGNEFFAPVVLYNILCLTGFQPNSKVLQDDFWSINCSLRRYVGIAYFRRKKIKSENCSCNMLRKGFL